MNSNSVSILERIEQERKKHNNIDGRVDDVGDDGPDNGPIENPETAIQKLKGALFDLKKNINCGQNIDGWTSTPMIEFCRKGDLLMCRFLQLHGASCTKRGSDGDFPMYTAAYNGKFEICQWLYNDCGDTAEDINREICNSGYTPLWVSIFHEYVLQSQWFVLRGGALQLSERALERLRLVCRDEDTVGPAIMSWTRMNIIFHDTTFLMFLCGCASTSTTNADTHTANTCTMNPQDTLPLLNGQPGVMELIGHYAGLIYGTKIRRLKEFNDLIACE